jgi:hypothetical protein
MRLCLYVGSNLLLKLYIFVGVKSVVEKTKKKKIHLSNFNLRQQTELPRARIISLYAYVS